MFPSFSEPFGFSEIPNSGLYGSPPGDFVAKTEINYPSLVYGLEGDGVNDRAEITPAVAPIFNGFSCAGWIVSLALSGNKCVFVTNTASLINQFLLRIDGNNLVIYSIGPGGGVTPVSALGAITNTGQKYHIAFTVDINYVIRLYLNGLLVNSTSIIVANRPTGISHFRFFAEGAGSNVFQGRLAGWCILTRELSADEIQGLFLEGNFNLSTNENLEAYYSFDQLAPTSTQIFDGSPNERHLNLINFVPNPIVVF